MPSSSCGSWQGTRVRCQRRQGWGESKGNEGGRWGCRAPPLCSGLCFVLVGGCMGLASGAHSGGLPLGPGPVLWVGIRVLLGYPFPRDSPWVSRPTPQGFHAHNSEKRLDLRGAKEGSGTERRPR